MVSSPLHISLSDQIKFQTKQQHQELEAVLIPQIKSIRSNDDYAKLLSLFYGYFAPLEKDIGALMDFRLPDFDQRRKTGTILRDLDFIEHKGYFPVQDYVYPEIQNFFQALGALYVMEGSTLGGKFIANMIGRQLNFHSEMGLSFFNGYGAATGNMWKQFLHILNDPQFSILEREAAIFSAKNTFTHFTSWVRLYYKI